MCESPELEEADCCWTFGALRKFRQAAIWAKVAYFGGAEEMEGGNAEGAEKEEEVRRSDAKLGDCSKFEESSELGPAQIIVSYARFVVVLAPHPTFGIELWFAARYSSNRSLIRLTKCLTHGM